MPPFEIKSRVDQESISEIRELLYLFWSAQIPYCMNSYHGLDNAHSLDGLVLYLDAKRISNPTSSLESQMINLAASFYESPYYYAAAKWGLSSDEACSLFQQGIPLEQLIKTASNIAQFYQLSFPTF